MLDSIFNSLQLAASNSAPRVSPFYAFEQSDNFGRLVVLLLFFASILAWSIMVEKWQTVRRTKLDCEKLQNGFSRMRLTEFLCDYEKFAGPMVSITQAVTASMAELFQLSESDLKKEISRDGIPPSLCDAEVEKIKVATTSRVDNEIMVLEERLGLLSSIVSASPFLGLLGTVWGVMMAFTGMAVQGKADIKAIAPGVSGALLTTVVGLLVAIPAVIGYNILVNRVKILTVQLDNYAETLLSAIKVASQKDGGN